MQKSKYDKKVDSRNLFIDRLIVIKILWNSLNYLTPLFPNLLDFYDFILFPYFDNLLYAQRFVK